MRRIGCSLGFSDPSSRLSSWARKLSRLFSTLSRSVTSLRRMVVGGIESPVSTSSDSSSSLSRTSSAVLRRLAGWDAKTWDSATSAGQMLRFRRRIRVSNSLRVSSAEPFLTTSRRYVSCPGGSMGCSARIRSSATGTGMRPLGLFLEPRGLPRLPRDTVRLPSVSRWTGLRVGIVVP